MSSVGPPHAASRPTSTTQETPSCACLRRGTGAVLRQSSSSPTSTWSASAIPTVPTIHAAEGSRSCTTAIGSRPTVRRSVRTTASGWPARWRRARTTGSSMGHSSCSSRCRKSRASTERKHSIRPSSRAGCFSTSTDRATTRSPLAVLEARIRSLGSGCPSSRFQAGTCQLECTSRARVEVTRGATSHADARTRSRRSVAFSRKRTALPPSVWRPSTEASAGTPSRARRWRSSLLRPTARRRFAGRQTASLPCSATSSPTPTPGSRSSSDQVAPRRPPMSRPRLERSTCSPSFRRASSPWILGCPARWRRARA